MDILDAFLARNHRYDFNRIRKFCINGFPFSSPDILFTLLISENQRSFHTTWNDKVRGRERGVDLLKLLKKQ